MKNYVSVILWPLLTMSSLVGCSAFDSGVDTSLVGLSSECNDQLKTAFAQTFQPVMVKNCASCHAQGGVGKGAFADTDRDVAFEEFQLRGFQTVGDRAVDPNHQAPFTGPQLEPEIEAASQQWELALASAQNCETDEPDDSTLPDDEPIPESATYLTVDKMLAMGDAPLVMSWDLTNDVVMPSGVSYAGARFEVTISRDTSATGETSYLLSEPQLTAGATALRVTYVEIYINGEFVSTASTYRGINRYVPQNQTRELSQTTMVVPFDVAGNDTLAMAFGILDPVDFAPTSFSVLTSSIFAQSCNGCHSGNAPAAGLDMTDYDGLLSQYMVIPFSTNGSEIYKRMTDMNNPMPPNGLLPQATQNQIRDWVRDGAPQ